MFNGICLPLQRKKVGEQKGACVHFCNPAVALQNILPTTPKSKAILVDAAVITWFFVESHKNLGLCSTARISWLFRGFSRNRVMTL